MNKIPTILAILLLIPVTLWAVFQNQDLRRAAFGTEANIEIDLAQTSGPLPKRIWQNFAQGGEEADNMLTPVVKQTAELNPQLIRIDHLYDHHVKIDQSADGQVSYDFSQLDEIVNTILNTGAKPMFVFSYMPPALSSDGKNVSQPNNWLEWQRLIRATVRRYSGKNGFNLDNVYYEVWNEPDLFGNWHYGRQPNYLTLYYHTVKAAQEVPNTNSFQIGGPATTGFYPNWIKALLKYCHQNNLRIDFISWHRYAKNLKAYDQDFDKLNTILTDYPEYFTLERLITEFGPDSENSAWYDNKLSAIHSIASMTKLMGKVHRVFTFEIIDGPGPKKHWGRWGLLTHDSHGVSKKPRFNAYTFLNQLNGQRVSLSGEGSWVKAVATREENKIQVLLVNYDPWNRHYESTPITLNNIQPGTYQFSQQYFQGPSKSNQEVVDSTEITKKIILQPNSAVLLEWEKL
jgi:xylan 1,4-beta-xylosidase